MGEHTGSSCGGTYRQFMSRNTQTVHVEEHTGSLCKGTHMQFMWGNIQAVHVEEYTDSSCGGTQTVHELHLPKLTTNIVYRNLFTANHMTNHTM